MAESKPTFADQMEDFVLKEKVFMPASEFVNKLTLALPKREEEGRLKSIIAGMAKLARSMSHKQSGGRRFKSWLMKAARTLDDCQILERSWISGNVWKLPAAAPKKVSEDFNPGKVTKDVRLQTDPTLERRMEDAATGEVLTLPTVVEAIVPETSEGVLNLEDEIMEIDRPGWEILSSPPKPERPDVIVPLPVSPKTCPTAAAGGLTTEDSQGRESIIVRPDAPLVRPKETKKRSSAEEKNRPKSAQPVKKARHEARVHTEDRADRRRDDRADRRRESDRDDRRRDYSRSGYRGNQDSTSSRSGNRRYSESRGRQSRKPEHSAVRESYRPSSSFHEGSEHRKVFKGKKGAIKMVVTQEVPKKQHKEPETRTLRRRGGEWVCWVPDCHEATRYPKCHAFLEHVPGIFDERLLASDVQVLEGRKRALKQAATWLLGRPGTWEDLVRFVRMQRLMSGTDNSLVSDVQREAMIHLAQHLHEPIPAEGFQLEPLNSVAALVHWKAVMLLVSRLEPEEQVYWKEMFPALEVLIDLPVAYDSHFHLDRTIHSMNLPKGSSLEDVLTGTPVPEKYRVNLVGACASFCDPATYPTAQEIQAFPGKMTVALGLHPKQATKGRQGDNIKMLTELLRLERVVALGEVGIDHSESRNRWPDQMDLLDRLLPLTSRDQVLILHCRGMAGDDGTEAFLLLLHMVKQHVHPEQRIYLHCYTGNEYVYERWMAAFPNLYLGFTRAAANFSRQQSAVLKSMSSSRLLLETDAPYFTLPEQRWSAPNQLLYVAECVSRFRNETPTTLLQIAAENAQGLFRRC